MPLQQNFSSFVNKIQNVRVFISGEQISQEINGNFCTWDLSSSKHIAIEEFISPDSNFVIVWRSSFLQFLQSPGKKYNIFILYNILCENTNVHTLQFQVRRLNLNGDFLTDMHSKISTGSQQNLLSIASTTRCWNYLLSFENENVTKEISELLKQLDFKKYVVDTFYLSQEYEQTGEMHFFNKNTTSMWYGTLISITKTNFLKIYSEFESNVLALIRSLEAATGIAITVSDPQMHGNYFESNFEKCLQDEVEFVRYYKDKIRNQPSTSRGNGIVKATIKELQRLTDLQMKSDLEYKKCEYSFHLFY